MKKINEYEMSIILINEMLNKTTSELKHSKINFEMVKKNDDHFILKFKTMEANIEADCHLPFFSVEHKGEYQLETRERFWFIPTNEINLDDDGPEFWEDAKDVVYCSTEERKILNALFEGKEHAKSYFTLHFYNKDLETEE